jgi:microcystin-dependent protein
MGAIDTNYTFTATDVITSTKMNNILDQSTITATAVFNNTLDVASGKLLVKAGGITSNEIAADAVVTVGILDGAVTASKLAAGAAIPAGAVMPFAMNSVPSGWLGADGTAVSRSTYAALFAAISTLYGVGDGSTTFNLPDLRGYFVRGSGTNVDGTVSGTFAAKQADELKSHTHTYTFKSTTGGSSAGGDPNSITNTSVNTGATGGTETRPKNIAMLYCVKY